MRLVSWHATGSTVLLPALSLSARTCLYSDRRVSFVANLVSSYVVRLFFDEFARRAEGVRRGVLTIDHA